MSIVDSFKRYFSDIQKYLSQTSTDKELFEAIVNAPFQNKLYSTNIDLGIVVLVLANKKSQTLDRVAYSKTPPAIDAVEVSPIAFLKIKIPINDKLNITAKAFKQNKCFQTSDWRFLFTPALNATEARFNQAESGMACSVVYPFFNALQGGALIYSFYQPEDMISQQHHVFMKKYTALAEKMLAK